MSDETRLWGWWLLQIGTPLVALVGLTGNCLSLLVLKSARFRTKSYSHYLCALAVFDSLVLTGKYVHRIDGLLLATGHYGLFQSYSDAACKIHNFIEHVCYLMSSWLVLCMTLERFIAVNFPFKKDSFCRPRHAVTVILVVFASLSYSQIFRLVIVESDGESCTAPERYRHVYVVLHIYLYQIVLQFALPALLILAANMVILRRIRALRRGMQALNNDSIGTTFHRGRPDTPNNVHQHNHQLQQQQPLADCMMGESVLYGPASQPARNCDRRSRPGSVSAAAICSGAVRSSYRVTAMLLVVSFSYVGCLLPLVLLSLIIHVSLLTDPNLASRLFVALDDCRCVFEFISELNYAANFYIYVMSGVQFRNTLRRVVCRCCRRRSGLNVSHSNGRHRDDLRMVNIARRKVVTGAAVAGAGVGVGIGVALAAQQFAMTSDARQSSAARRDQSHSHSHHSHSDSQQQQQQSQRSSRQSPRQLNNVFHFRQFHLESCSDSNAHR